MKLNVNVIFTDTDGARTNKVFPAQTTDQATKLFALYIAKDGFMSFNASSVAAVAAIQQQQAMQSGGLAAQAATGKKK